MKCQPLINRSALQKEGVLSKSQEIGKQHMILKRLSQTALKTAAVIGGLCLSTSLMAAPSANEKSAIGINLTGSNWLHTKVDNT
jgi:hypothetical protein